MESSNGTRENINAQRLNQDFVVVDGCSDPTNVEDVVVRMAVPGRPMWHFIDEGEEVELYVTFADGVVGIPCTNSQSKDNGESYKVDLAGEEVCLKSLMSFKINHSTMFKATSRVTSTRSHALQAGQPVPFSLQYMKAETGDTVHEVEKVTDPNMPVYYQPVWKKLLERDDNLKQRINQLDGNGVKLYTHSGQPESSSGHPDSDHSGEAKPLLQRHYSRPETPKQLADDDYFLYYTRKACKPFFDSQNPFLKFVRELMVSPLTNFTGLSLYFQLYLVEIFHVKFFTKLGHYLCMPFIVLFTATWFAQWRLIGYYKIDDVSVFIVNGTLLFVCFLQAWYIIWGCLYKMPLFGIFMVWPLFFMYMLSNMLFQIIVINSFRLDESRMTAETIWGQNSSHWYDAITLAHFGVVWYLNPLLWALIFGALQAFSHICEDKLPPRVSQTAHWLDMTTILKRNGYVHFALILLSQTVFGTLNELFASPRLLPLLLLRLCYSLGYQEKQWVKFHMLVQECLKFGDPAIDYIGRGGASWPKEFRKWKPDNLDDEIKTIERSLTQELKENLKDPAFLQNKDLFTKELQQYVMLRHRLTKYKVQVEAYGPFTPREKVPGILDYNDTVMMNDFPENPAFRMFLDEARSHFAEMEYNFVEECKLNRVLL